MLLFNLECGRLWESDQEKSGAESIVLCFSSKLLMLVGRYSGMLGWDLPISPSKQQPTGISCNIHNSLGEQVCQAPC